MSDIIDKNLFLDTSTIYKLSRTSKEMFTILDKLPIQVSLRNSFDKNFLTSLENLTNKYSIVALNLEFKEIKLGFKSLIEVPGLWSSLTRLDLSHNYIGSIGVKSFEQLSLLSLTRLDLNYNAIGSKGANNLGVLGKCHNIAYLDLSNNYIGPDGAESLTGVLKKFTALTILKRISALLLCNFV
jgi:Leucine-rich repeat (LRR) protein